MMVQPQNQTNIPAGWVGDGWDTESGLPQEADVWVRRAWFGYDQNYQGGQALVLLWEVESTTEGFDRPIIWSLGSGGGQNGQQAWRTDQTQRWLLHETGNANKAVNKSTMFGTLINRCIETLGLREQMRSWGQQNDAQVWVGLGFHLIRETFSTGAGNRPEGMRESYEHYMPVAFLGSRKQGAQPAAVQAPAAPPIQQQPQPMPQQVAAPPIQQPVQPVAPPVQNIPPQQYAQPVAAVPPQAVVQQAEQIVQQAQAAPVAAAPVAAPAPTAVMEAPQNGVAVDPIVATLTTMARSMSVDQFTDGAIHVEGVSGNPLLMNDVMDEGPTGFWARANAPQV